MAYIPELNMEYSGVLRRIAWAYGVTMTKAIKGIIEHTGRYLDANKVCGACRDRSFCEWCLFKEKRQDKRQSNQEIPLSARVFPGN